MIQPNNAAEPSGKPETVGEIRNRARKNADAVLGQYWNGSLPVDPIQLARLAGTSVFSAQLGADTYGMIVGSGSSADIYVDVDQPLVRFRFTTAHELGHYIDHTVRGDRLPDSAGYLDRRSESGRGQPAEIYANEFAASLLMPEDRVRDFAESKHTLFEMADIFQVSVAAMSWRLHHLGISLVNDE